MWRFLTAEKDEADRQWARRQGAEAQNHVWDRYVSFDVKKFPTAVSYYYSDWYDC